MAPHLFPFFSNCAHLPWLLLSRRGTYLYRDLSPGLRHQVSSATESSTHCFSLSYHPTGRCQISLAKRFGNFGNFERFVQKTCTGFHHQSFPLNSPSLLLPIFLKKSLSRESSLPRVPELLLTAASLTLLTLYFAYSYLNIDRAASSQELTH